MRTRLLVALCLLSATIALSAQASDEGGIASVSFSVGGQSVGTDDVPPYEAAFAVPADAVIGSSICAR